MTLHPAEVPSCDLHSLASESNEEDKAKDTCQVSEDVKGKVWQVLTSRVIVVCHDPEDAPYHGQQDKDENCVVQLTSSNDESHKEMLSTAVSDTKLPFDVPNWALKLNECEVIGNSYRGWVGNESDLSLVLSMHKNETKSVWGTRQSPNSQCPLQRLMWKSHFVPYDGIPFINLGSRAIVMECQYGPRRKRGSAGNKEQADVLKTLYKQTCPARIYVKKVQKYPEFKVDLAVDRKTLRASMDNAFHKLRAKGFDDHGETRWYVQLPTEAGHNFHKDSHFASEEETNELVKFAEVAKGLTLHPSVHDKICQLVLSGEGRVYAIRKQLRRFVEKEMFHPDGKPDKHNLSYFPTVHNIQNHIYQALKDIQSGKLLLHSDSVILDPITWDKHSYNQQSNSTELLSKEPGREVPEEDEPEVFSEGSNDPSAQSVIVAHAELKDGGIISRMKTESSGETVQMSSGILVSLHLLSENNPEVVSKTTAHLVSASKSDEQVPFLDSKFSYEAVVKI